MTTLKSFPYGYFYRDKEHPLSPPLILALKKVYNKQKKKEPVGPKDIKKYLYPLIERGLIAFTFYDFQGEQKPTWNLTNKGLSIFKSVNRKRQVS